MTGGQGQLSRNKGSFSLKVDAQSPLAVRHKEQRTPRVSLRGMSKRVDDATSLGMDDDEYWQSSYCPPYSEPTPRNLDRNLSPKRLKSVLLPNSEDEISRGPSKYTGVSWNRKNQKWIVQLCLNGKQRYLGSFVDEEEAARTYDEYAMRLAPGRRLNFDPSSYDMRDCSEDHLPSIGHHRVSSTDRDTPRYLDVDFPRSSRAIGYGDSGRSHPRDEYLPHGSFGHHDPWSFSPAESIQHAPPSDTQMPRLKKSTDAYYYPYDDGESPDSLCEYRDPIRSTSRDY